MRLRGKGRREEGGEEDVRGEKGRKRRKRREKRVEG